MGVATSSTARAASYANEGDALGVSVMGTSITNALCIQTVTSSASTTINEADFVSMDPNGFTINVTKVSGTPTIQYLALGGNDLTNAYVGVAQRKTSTGTQAYTGVGFQPDAMMIFTMANFTSIPAISAVTNIQTTFGVCDGATSKVTANYIQYNVTTTNTERRQSSSIYLSLNGSGGVSAEATFTSFDSDGFTLNWTTANASATYFIVVCLKGGSYNVGTFNQNTSTGNQVVTGTGFEPTGVLFSAYMSTTSASTAAEARWSLGGASSSTSRGVLWSGSTDNQADSICDTYNDLTKVIKFMIEGTPTLIAEADFVSMDPNGFTINNTTVDANAREVVYFAHRLLTNEDPATTNRGFATIIG